MNYAFIFKNETGIEWGYPIALAKSMSPNIGEEIGNCIFYKDDYSDYCCEITAKEGTKLQLVACGWVEREKCRLIS